MKPLTPIDTFKYKYPPYEHQLEALRRSCFLREYAYLMDMGTGKSKVVLDNICILWEAGKITSAIIIAPNSVYRNWLLREIPKHLPEHILDRTRVWTHKQNKAEDLLEFLDGENWLNIILINVECFSYPSMEYLHVTLEKYVELTPTYMAVDESTTIKSKSKRNKVITRIGRIAAYRRIATGLVAPNGPMDVFYQFQFLKDGCLGTHSAVQFRHRYCKIVHINVGMRTIEKVVGSLDTTGLRDKMSELSYRISQDECLDLPGQSYDFINSELDDITQTYYDQMRKNAFVELENDAGQPIFVQTQNRINMLMRLQRITCGHLKDPESNEEVRFSMKRINDMVDFLEFIKPPVLIWTVFTRDIVDIVAALGKVTDPKRVAHYFGGTKTAQKDDAITMLDDGRLDYLVLNPASGRFGNTMVAAHTAIYHSNSPDLEHRDQSERRIYRIGQLMKCLYLDVLAPLTVNYHMITSLRGKINLSTAVMGDKFKEWLV